MPRCIELFAGAGGLALGLEKAGFETIGLVEFDKNACNTLRENRPQWNVIEGDVANVSCVNLEELFDIERYELDLLSGGAPCQAFSYAGKRLGLEDIRGTMFYHYAKFLEKLQPKMFVFENVKGLFSHDGGRTYRTMCDVFLDAGYTITYDVVNANDYGVAQNRERLITFGIRNDLFDNALFWMLPEDEEKLVLRDVLLDVPRSVGAKYSAKKEELFKLVPAGGNWRDIDEGIAREYMGTSWNAGGGRTGILRRLSMDEPSLTILTSPSQKQTDRCHPDYERPLTIRESARIQSFPDEWAFCGSMASQYRQIGNAVPVNLARAIGESIISVL